MSWSWFIFNPLTPSAPILARLPLRASATTRTHPHTTRTSRQDASTHAACSAALARPKKTRARLACRRLISTVFGEHPFLFTGTYAKWRADHITTSASTTRACARRTRAGPTIYVRHPTRMQGHLTSERNVARPSRRNLFLAGTFPTRVFWCKALHCPRAPPCVIRSAARSLGADVPRDSRAVKARWPVCPWTAWRQMREAGSGSHTVPGGCARRHKSTWRREGRYSRNAVSRTAPARNADAARPSRCIQARADARLIRGRTCEACDVFEAPRNVCGVCLSYALLRQRSWNLSQVR
jgi:hypothetical protein